MRSQLAARRIILAPALALTLAAAVAACSSSSSPSSSASTGATSAPASSAPASSTPASSSSSNAVAQITANWEKFFNASTPNSERVTLLQNGNAFSGAMSSLISLAPGLGATVTNVTLNSATSATVKYNLTAAGTSLLSNQTGTALLENGVWKVGDASLCSLIKLVPGGTVPAACNSAS
jgi:hypothetical protein